MADEHYRLYLDECGSPKPNGADNAPHFALGGVLVRSTDIDVIRGQIQAFKGTWGIEAVALHSYEIRHKRQNFSWLNKCEPARLLRFYDELTDLITSSPIVVCACVIHRQGYRARYSFYGGRTWNLLKSAAAIVIERAAKHVIRQGGGKMGVTFESCGRKEDSLQKQAFEQLKTVGHPFNPENASKYSPLAVGALQSTLTNIKYLKKSDELLQLADLCLFPVAYSRGQVRQAKPYEALRARGRLLDSYYPGELAERGIKYFCFDGGLEMTPPPEGGGAAT